MKPTHHPARGAGGLALRSLGVGGTILLAPKCALCLLGYAGLGAALGLTRPELCGATASSTSPWLWLSCLSAALAWLAMRRRQEHPLGIFRVIRGPSDQSDLAEHAAFSAPIRAIPIERR